MRTLWNGLAGLLLGLTLVGGAALAVSAQGTDAAAGSSYLVSLRAGHGAGLDAGTASRLGSVPAQPCDTQDQTDNGQETATDTDNVQEQNGQNDTTEGDTGKDATTDGDTGAKNPADTDTTQCGDQNGPDSATGGNLASGLGHIAVLGHGLNARALTAPAGQTGPTAATRQTEQGTATEPESPTEAEDGSGNDQATDGIVCDQQGQQEGENQEC